jgi:hypothetical protein
MRILRLLCTELHRVNPENKRRREWLGYVAVLVMVAHLRLGAFPQMIDSFYAT